MMKHVKHNLRYITISSEQAGQRIDNFLIRLLQGVPKGHIYNLLRRGEVRINKGRIKPTYRLQESDQLRLAPIKEAVPARQAIASKELMDKLYAAILYEEEDFFCIDKPAGLAVHGGSGLSIALIEALRQMYPQYKEMELVHRLDRDTSGCLLIAKKRRALREIHTLLRAKQVTKRYLALVEGVWEGKLEKHVNVPLLKNTVRSGERIVRVDLENGKPSHTLFKLQEQWTNYSLLEVIPYTGRTHQIRVHAAHMGYPIVGDNKYGKSSKQAKRLFLHAISLNFTYRERKIAINAPLPSEFLLF